MSKKQNDTPQHTFTSNPTASGTQRLPGRIIVNYGNNQVIEDANGSLLRSVARRRLKQLVCGDAIEWSPSGDNEAVIEALKPRKTALYRVDGSNTQRPLVANINQIVIEAALEPALDTFLIDKYTVAAELANTVPMIVINKADLLTDADRTALQPLVDEYESLGYRVLFTSALENTGIDAFAAQLEGKASILVGQSGVGKSSLVKRLLPDLDIVIGKLSDASGLGKHTTSTTTLYPLPAGGSLVDSPGVRDFRLGEVEAIELQNGFIEFRPWLGHCKFNDCRHLDEPGCAITQALENGEIPERRMQSYRRLLES